MTLGIKSEVQLLIIEVSEKKGNCPHYQICSDRNIKNMFLILLLCCSNKKPHFSISNLLSLQKVSSLISDYNFSILLRYFKSIVFSLESFWCFTDKLLLAYPITFFGRCTFKQLQDPFLNESRSSLGASSGYMVVKTYFQPARCSATSIVRCFFF